MSFNTKNNNKGVTLIALVITIIVLLILAGVSIATLTGQDGILTKAKDAASQTKQSTAEEQVTLAVTGSYGASGIDYRELEENLKKIDGIDESTVPSPITDTSFPITVKIDEQEVTIKADGTLKKQLPTTTTAPTTAVTTDTIFKDTESNNKEAIIPKDFKVSSVAEEQKVSTGLVVIAPDNSQFVWVPVDKTTLCADGTSNKEMAEISNGTDYRGVLYDFSGTTSTKRNYSLTGYREPAYLTDSNYADASSYNTIELTADSLQQEYNSIINSIKTNGGFYVGRYESSISGTTIKSVSGVTPMSAETDSQIWYGMYAKEKAYATNLNTAHFTNVKSAMIYGSTYDAMLNWALNNPTDNTKVTASSTKHGPENTGALVTDKINNILDLGNNLYEWTAEANGTSYRVKRGRLLRQHQFSELSLRQLSEQHQQLLW